MILYHFTCWEHLPAILKEGLTRGDVPTSATEGVTAVWLTTDETPLGHGLSDGGQLPREEVEELYRMGKVPSPDVIVETADKTEIRIAVEISSLSSRLKKWDKWAKKRLDPHWLNTLHQADGEAFETWWLHFGTIPPNKFAAVEVRGPNGYEPYREATE